MTGSPYLRIRSIKKSYKGAVALHDIDLDVEQGAFVSLLGPSGCGKSTLLQILAGLLEADGGDVQLGGEDITNLPPWRRNIGLVFQNYALFPHLSIRQNVRFGLDMLGMDRTEAEKRVDESLAMVGLDPALSRKPGELSGGQQQRVAIARAIAIRPRLLLLDEPLSNLDAVLRHKVRLELRELHDRTGITTIMVTHDQAEALATSDRIAVMNGGRILQYEAPEALYRAPATAFIAGFVGSPPANLVPLSALDNNSWTLANGQVWKPIASLAPRAAGVRAGAACIMALRPEALAVGVSGEGGLPGRVVAIEFIGGDRLVHVETGGTQLTVRVSAEQAMAGPDILLFPPQETPLLFDANSGKRLKADF
ncbi:ABC transporter ATP-binding protein [Devosia epidermidihirudinis]|uniref:ABC transporter ATP-binding protein n=1 Tax=Devosia epidermidihirudinis TaxID=1293439 RepID=UPI000697DF58|nr:ABC transporter ATP-binding protein [Devosia epidermidihirudinis]